MHKRGPRPTFFVCISLDAANNLISKEIEASSTEEASKKFLEQTNCRVRDIYGPYRHKKKRVISNTRVIKFGDKSFKCFYGDWEVMAFILKEPLDHAYLIFVKNNNNQKEPIPKGTTIVPVSKLKEIK